MAKLCKIDRRILKFYWNFAYETILNFICDVIHTILRHIICLLYGDMVKIGWIYKKSAIKSPFFAQFDYPTLLLFSAAAVTVIAGFCKF